MRPFTAAFSREDPASTRSPSTTRTGTNDTSEPSSPSINSMVTCAFSDLFLLTARGNYCVHSLTDANGADISTNCHFDQSVRSDQQPLPARCNRDTVQKIRSVILRRCAYGSSQQAQFRYRRPGFVSYLGPTRRGTSQSLLRGSLLLPCQ